MQKNCVGVSVPPLCWMKRKQQSRHPPFSRKDYFVFRFSMLHATTVSFPVVDLNLPFRKPAIAPLTIYDLPVALEPAGLPAFEARELLVAACQARLTEIRGSEGQLSPNDHEALSLFLDPASNDIIDSRTGKVWLGRVTRASAASTAAMPESSPLLTSTATPQGVGTRQPSDLPPSLELPQAAGSTPNGAHSRSGANGLAGFAPHPRTRSFRLPYDVTKMGVPGSETANPASASIVTDIEDSEPMYAAADRAYLGAVSGGYDCYLDPVTRELHFTEEFLRQGGRCCGYSCRHCPFRNTAPSSHATHTPQRQGVGKRGGAGNGTLVLGRSPQTTASDKSSDSDYRSSSASEDRGNTTSDTESEGEEDGEEW
jgi:hypothetical protein